MLACEQLIVANQCLKENNLNQTALNYVTGDTFTAHIMQCILTISNVTLTLVSVLLRCDCCFARNSNAIL